MPYVSYPSSAAMDSGVKLVALPEGTKTLFVVVPLVVTFTGRELSFSSI